MKKLGIVCAFLLTFNMAVWSQAHVSTQPHSSRINSIVASPSKGKLDSSYFSIGDDGFVIKWSDDGQGEHYQLTTESLKMIACSPIDDIIAVYESDGGSVNKISIWNWDTLTKIKSIKFTDSITSLKFSARGTYLMVGTATMDGVRFFSPSTGREVTNKLKDNTGIVSYMNTSDTEKTSVFYSPTGTLAYYNMGTGKAKAKVSMMKGLTNTVLYNGSNLFAGLKDDNICIIDPTKGSTIATIHAKNPIILSTESDKNLYYLEYDGRYTYELKMIESLDNRSVSNPRIVKTMRGPRSDVRLVGTKDAFNFYIGTSKGDIYTSSVDASDSSSSLTAVTIDSYSPIYGMAPADSDFYFLTSNKIYKSSYETSIVENVASTNGETNISAYKKDKVILWSKSTRDPVVLVDLTTQTRTDLFKPQNNIQSLRVSSIGNKDYIVEIEGNSTVNLYDIKDNKFRQIYNGAGVQDAVLTHNGNIYVAKSAATNPQVPMLCINIETLETVPVKQINGNVVYALSTDGTVVYGIKLIQIGDALNTYVFSYHTLTNKYTDLLKFTNEDSEAFTYLNGSSLFTNIGKNKVYCYNLDTRRNFSFNRSASIPQSVCKNGHRVVILNYNGSISWCTAENAALETDWYLTKDEQWREF